MAKKIFPQANNFEKIFTLLHLDESDLQDNEKIMHIIQVGPRQVNYYLSALEYLGLINNRMFTELGVQIKQKDLEMQKKVLIRTILSFDVFFDVYYEIVFLGKTLNNKAIGTLIYTKMLVDSEDVAERRASTVKSWIVWIMNQIKQNTKSTIVHTNHDNTPSF